MSIERAEGHPIARAVALSVIATTALHGYIELETTHAHGWRVEMGTLNPWAHKSTHTMDLGTVAYGDPYVQTTTTHTEVPGDPTTEHDHREMFVAGDYSRKFSLDPNAGKFDEQAMRRTAKTINKLEQEGWSVSVLVQGQASAEDENDAADDGLQTPSELNVKLASDRGQGTTDALIAAGVEERNIIQKEGHEDSWSDEQMVVLEGLRDQYGYTSVLSMIEAHHLKPETVPEHISDLLKSWIDNKQGTVVIIDAQRQVAGPGTDEVKTERVCIVPVLKDEAIITNTDSNKATIPYGLLIMLGIPSLTGLSLVGADWLRRERAYRERKQLLEARRSALPVLPSGEVSGGGGGAGGGGGGGAGGDSDPEPEAGPVPVDEVPEPAPAEETPDPVVEPNVEEEPPVDPPEKTPKDRRRLRLWPLILPPLIAAGIALALNSCDPDPKPSAPTPTTAPADPCEGLPHEQKVVGTKTVTVQDGFTRKPVITLDK